MWIVDGSVPERRFVAFYRRGALITAVLGWNMPSRPGCVGTRLIPVGWCRPRLR
jgi:hypothetical protein